MYMTQEQPNQTALSIDKCASALGIDEFSLLSRVQTGDIKAVRARSGEVMIPETELERLVPRHCVRLRMNLSMNWRIYQTVAWELNRAGD